MINWPPLLGCLSSTSNLAWGFLGGAVVKNQPANAGDTRDVGSVPGSGRSPGEGNGNLGQDSCLGTPMDRGACWDIVHGVAKEST